MMQKTWARIGIALVLAVAVGGCSPIVRNHGYVPSDAELAELTVGVDTRETVDETVGTPSSSGVLRESGYYYVAQRVETRGARAPQVVDRQVVAISFTDEGVVSNIERLTLEDGEVVALSRRVTDTSIANVSFLRQLLGNFGRLDAENFF